MKHLYICNVNKCNMGLDIKKLRHLQKYLDKKAEEEQLVKYILTAEQIEKYIEFEKAKKKVEQSPRVLNNWTQQGIINPPEEGKKRTYSKLDAIWIELVAQLREFGLGLEKIKSVRDFLFENKIDGSNFSPIKYAIVYSLMVEPYILLIYNDGTINLMSKSQYLNYLSDELILPIHVSVNLLDISKTEFPKNGFTDFSNDSDLATLTKKELELLYYLRTGDYDEIKVRMENGEIYLIESSMKLNVNTKVVDIINKSAFQDIEIKVRDGKAILIKSTELKK